MFKRVPNPPTGKYQGDWNQIAKTRRKADAKRAARGNQPNIRDTYLTVIKGLISANGHAEEQKARAAMG